jgi:hypothetical protein
MSVKREKGLGATFETLRAFGALRAGRPRSQKITGQFPDHGANLRRYSVEIMKALTMSALTKLPLKSFSFCNQKL